MDNKKILILGGNGFIGRMMCKKLKENGYSVEVFDRESKTNNSLDGIKYIYGDFLNFKSVEKALEGHKNVLHLISTVTPSSSIKEPLKGYQEDLIQTVKILEILEKNNGRLFFTSSGGTVYGIQEKFPINEDANTNPINHYGITKLSIEKIICMYNSLYSMNNVVFRISNPYGPGQDYRTGGVGVIDAFLRKTISRDQIQIYGDGNVSRDFIYIDTLCEYLFKIIDKEKCDHDVYNIGSGVSYSLNNILELIQLQFKLKPNVKYLDKRGIDVPKTQLDISRLINEFGISESVSLKDGIKKTMEAYDSWQSTGVDSY